MYKVSLKQNLIMKNFLAFYLFILNNYVKAYSHAFFVFISIQLDASSRNRDVVQTSVSS